jgi:tRNA(fMet)-specific endonuclease VapC
MRYLLDTCVISELTARQPNYKVIEWIDRVAEEHLLLSVITLGEIKRGIDKLPDSRKKRDLDQWLEEGLLLRFKGRILPLDAGVMLTWGELTARLEKSGRTLPAIDSLVAALALHHQLHLATRNEKDFLGTGVQIINPWAW